MSSVFDFIQCPRCREDAYYELYHNTSEEETSCMHCGYNYEARYQRDENNDLITKDGTQNYAFDNLIFKVTEHKPYAVFHLKPNDGMCTQTGTFDNEQNVTDFKAHVLSNSDTIERAFVSRYDEGQKKIIVEELA